MSRRKIRVGITDFWFGFICGMLFAIIGFSVVLGIIHFNKRDMEVKEYAEKQIEIEALREDVTNRPVDEFLNEPDVRRAADGAAADFERKRDEALFRFRNRTIDR
ncbi:hypothetical protein [Treponema sp. R80B11-R83G3]